MYEKFSLHILIIIELDCFSKKSYKLIDLDSSITT